jgi:transposase
VDECEVHLHPRLAKLWQKRGQPRRVPAAGADHKFVVFGALDYATGRLISRLHARKNSEAFIALLEQLRQAFPHDKLVVVLDNVGYHNSHRVRGWWHRWRTHICPFFLPAYTPELNLIERVWRHVKDKLSCHRWWADWDTLWQATETLLRHLQARFHQRHEPSIEVVHNFCASA